MGTEMGPDPTPQAPQTTLLLHATTVALTGKAVLFRGPAGSGKSGLALQMIGLGALLVADDRTHLSRQGENLVARAHAALNGMIEARYVGILNAPVTASAPLALIIDMSEEETDRLPAPRHETLLGLSVPVIRKSSAPHFPVSIALYLQGGRLD